jgi:hypothetical protein
VVEFNDYFKALITDRRKEASDQRIAFLTSSSVSSPLRFREDLLTIQLICDSANNVYEQMVRDGLWSSTVKKNLPASQVLNTSTLTCFNCGKSHHIRDCPEPRNIQLVSQNKTKFRQQKSSGNTTSQSMSAPNRGNNRNQRVSGAGTSNSANQRTKSTKKRAPARKSLFKWRPPDHDETRRLISTQDHGERLYEWNASTRRWTPEEVPAANVANLQPTTDAALRAQVADVQRQLHALNARL